MIAWFVTSFWAIGRDTVALRAGHASGVRCPLARSPDQHAHVAATNTGVAGSICRAERRVRYKAVAIISARLYHEIVDKRPLGMLEFHLPSASGYRGTDYCYTPS